MFDVGGFINDYWGVIGVDVDSRFIGVVCCFYYVWIIGCQDQVDVWVMYQCVRQFYRWLIDLVNQVFWCVGCDGSLQYDISCFVGGFFCMWVWRENDGVMCFQIDE